MKIECSKEAKKNSELFKLAKLYAEEGRGSLFSNDSAQVSATNFLGGNIIEFKNNTDMRKVLRSSGWQNTSEGVWKPRIKV